MGIIADIYKENGNKEHVQEITLEDKKHLFLYFPLKDKKKAPKDRLDFVTGNYPGEYECCLKAEGLELTDIQASCRLKIGQGVYLRVIQTTGYVTASEGFAGIILVEVLLGGKVNTGDSIVLYPKYRFAVVTASDKGSQSLREDTSGPLIKEMLMPWGDVAEYLIVPDERERLRDVMIDLADQKKVDIVFTTGGTGFSPRDVTPEATRSVIERETPGISEAMRLESLKVTPKAMLSRAIAGIRGKTLVINLPGSPKAVRENLAVFLQVIDHALEILTGGGGECGQE